jgi:hypothetical protein
MQFQTNPTNAGHRDASVELRDGDQILFRLHRTITVPVAMDIVVRAVFLYIFVVFVLRLIGGVSFRR